MQGGGTQHTSCGLLLRLDTLDTKWDHLHLQLLVHMLKLDWIKNSSCMGRNKPKLIHRWEAAWGTQALQIDLIQRLVQCKSPVSYKDTIARNGKPKLCSAQPLCWGNPSTTLDFILLFFNICYNVSLCRNTLAFKWSIVFYPLSLPHKLCLDNHTHCGQRQEKPTLCLCPVPYSVLTPCQDIGRVQDLSLQLCHRLFFSIGFPFKMLV